MKIPPVMLSQIGLHNPSKAVYSNALNKSKNIQNHTLPLASGVYY